MSPNKHHHGDLREALIDAGLALLAENGAEGLTLRRAAARAGVTHAAPAHHFDGLDGLRCAIAQRGFENLGKILQAADGRSASNGHTRLIMTSAAYIEFAQKNSALFELMYRQVKTGNDLLKEAAGNCYLLLREICSQIDHGQDKIAFECALWAMLHGYASLDLGNRRPVNGTIKPPAYNELLNVIIPPTGTNG